jgi:hypothetical protein
MLALMPRANHTCRSLVARWLIAFCRASKWYIREDEPLAKELTPWLEPNELKQLVRVCAGRGGRFLLSRSCDDRASNSVLGRLLELLHYVL